VTNVTPTCGILASISLPTSGLRKAYSSTGASVAITERFNQTPCFYRVKASRSGYFDSGWQNRRRGSRSQIFGPGANPDYFIGIGGKTHNERLL
jgi:hypothetical protein